MQTNKMIIFKLNNYIRKILKLLVIHMILRYKANNLHCCRPICCQTVMNQKENSMRRTQFIAISTIVKTAIIQEGAMIITMLKEAKQTPNSNKEFLLPKNSIT